MKKTGITLIALAFGLILFASFSRQVSPIPSNPSENFPDSVWMVLEKSCYGCHSDDGNGMAKAKLNFDSWDEYADDKQLAKAQNMCNIVKKGKMPPSKFLKNNPESALTDANVALICSWADQKGK